MQEMPGEEAAIAVATPQSHIKISEEYPLLIMRAVTDECFVANFVMIMLFILTTYFELLQLLPNA